MRAPYDIPRRRRGRSGLSLAGLIAVLVVLAAAIDMAVAWLLMAVIHAFGHEQVGYWPCLGVVVLINLLLGSGRCRS